MLGGRAEGQVLHSDTGLSFWGGVDPLTSTVVDHTHPLFSCRVAGRVLAIPNGRGSCTGSQVVLELILNGMAPAALLLRQPDAILALGVVVAQELFGQAIPIVSLGPEGFDKVSGAAFAAVDGGVVIAGASLEEVQAERVRREQAGELPPPRSPEELLRAAGLQLTVEEHDMLSGGKGEATKLAMRVLARAAAIEGARELLPVTQAHIDGCTYIGPGGLRFAQRLADLGGRVAVPTTLNSNSVDRRQWRALGVPESLGVPVRCAL